MQPCTVAITNRVFETGEEEEYLESELQGDDLEDDKGYRMINVKGLTADWA